MNIPLKNEYHGGRMALMLELAFLSDTYDSDTAFHYITPSMNIPLKKEYHGARMALMLEWAFLTQRLCHSTVPPAVAA